jgi:undecaprenyl-phosphate 4-deoxy-4-formamido-L-arabinose transferase
VVSTVLETRFELGPPTAALTPARFAQLSIVIPVYNSERTIGPLVDTLVGSFQTRFERLEIILVNDGSRDRSHAVALQAVRRHPAVVRYLRLSRNFGEHNAVMCGLNHATGDCVVIMDDDFQNPPSEVQALVDKLGQGYDVVYSCYERKQHSWLRNLGSRCNDWVARKVLNKPPDLYLSSFKALNAFLVKQVTRYAGPYPYLDGLILRFTDSIGTQLVRHAPRTEGHSNYNLKRLFRLWLNMFTTCSVVPLRAAAVIGLGMSVVGVGLGVLLIERLVGGVLSDQAVTRGWASLIVCVTVFAGIQLCVLGMIGEYLGRLYLMQNRLPQYVVRELVTEDDLNSPVPTRPTR